MTVKSVLKKLPGRSRLRNWAADMLSASMTDKQQVLRGFIDGNGWLFTQPKTGTNLIANTIAFYNAEVLGLENYGYEGRYTLGLVHGGRITRSAEGIREALRFQRRSDKMLITRTHDDVPGACPEFLICTSRGVLDQFVSMWHYRYKAAEVSVDKALSQ